MIKKFLLPLVVVAGMFSGAVANDMGTGFSIGVNLENDSFIDQRTKYTTSTGVLTQRDHIGGRGFGAGLNVGYRQCYDKVWAGVEVGASLMNAKSRATSVTNLVKFNAMKVKNSYNGKIKLGVKPFAETSIYLLGGYQNAKLRAEYIDSVSGAKNKRDKRKSGALFGAGVEIPMMTDNLALSLEYSEMTASKFKVIRTDGVTDKHKVGLGTVALGVKAYF